MTAREEALVDPPWLADRLAEAEQDDPDLVVLEVDLDTDAYDAGHVPGAHGLDWERDLRAHPERDILGRDGFAALCGSLGIREGSTVVLYGDHHNWFAAHAYWTFRYHGHDDVRLLDGGREGWLAGDYPVTEREPDPTPREYSPGSPRESVRAYRANIEAALDRPVPLLDTRSEAEFTGELIAPPGMAETAVRGGRIPGATRLHWSWVTDEAGRFRPTDELRELATEHGVTGDGSAITYCRIGERSSVVWFALSELCGYDAANYDGSWVEWGNSIGQPVATGTPEDRPNVPVDVRE